MQINTLVAAPDAVYFDHAFLVMMEDHMTFLRQSPNINLLKVTEHQNYKYEGDLLGLLNDLAIDKKYHFITIRVNGYESSGDFKGDVQYLILPDLAEIDLLKATYLTKNNF